jgi:hypothetical protein
MCMSHMHATLCKQHGQDMPHRHHRHHHVARGLGGRHMALLGCFMAGAVTHLYLPAFSLARYFLAILRGALERLACSLAWSCFQCLSRCSDDFMCLHTGGGGGGGPGFWRTPCVGI